MARQFQVLYDYSDVPTLKKFALDNSRVRMAMGPFGSGKSSACVMEIIRRGNEQKPSPDGIRRTRWAVVRNCYSDDTEILTEKRGWQLFKDLLLDDKVASLVDDHLVFKLPNKVVSFPYKGDMIGFENEGVNFLVTPEHKMWVSTRRTRKKVWGNYEIKTAEEIYGNQTVRVKRNAKWKITRKNDNLALFEWIGFWVAEGHANEYRYGKHKVLRCAITQKDNLGYVRNLFSGAGIPYRESKAKCGVSIFTVKINEMTKALIRELIPLGKACSKTVPKWIKESTSQQISSFIKGYLAGDGQHSKDGSVRASTGSKQLADDIQELALRAGMVVNISVQDHIGRESKINGITCRTNTLTYILTFLCPHKYNPILYVNKKTTNKLIGWYKKPYDGYVYCVEMEEVPVYVRRKGKGFWCVRSYNQLKDTTIKTFHDWFPPIIFGDYRITDHTYIITKFPNVHIEVLFRALDRPDQVSNLLSLELTGAWFNEVREIPKSIIEAMDGRIGRYPSGRDGGASWYGIIMDTNPPDEDSYLYKMFEKVRPDNWRIFKQPSGLSIHAENTKYLPKGYYTNLAKGKDEMYKRIYIDGQYGYFVSGKPVFTSFVDNIHIARSPIEPKKGLDVIVGFDFGLCYDDQTEVLTKAGWKFFKDVRADDMVMTKNFETDIIEYHKPLKRIARHHEGEMFLYENHNVNFCVTPEHIIPCRKRYGKYGKVFTGDHRLSAERLYNDISKHYAVDLRGKWGGCSDGVFGPLNWPAAVFAEFMGLYLSEGSCDKVHNRISIAQNKTVPAMEKMLGRTGLRWIRSNKSWRVSNKLLNEYLNIFGYASEKRVPDEIKNMESEEILKFINAYTMGDGHIRTRANGAVEHTIFTVSKLMAGDFQELALKVGWHAKIRVVKPQNSVIFENGKSRIIHNEGGYSITFKKKKGTCSELVKKDYSRVQYSGMVYCMTVPHGTLYIRRKNTPSWNGNTPACVIGQITPLGQLMILDELVSDGMGLKQFCENQLLPLLRRKYFGMRVMGFGDPSGVSRAPTDESTCFEILQGQEVGLRDVVPCFTNAITARVGAVEAFLNKMYQGEPGFILSPNCHFLRKAMNGGYHYEKDPKSTSEEFKPMPTKNFSSHICDALQYLCLYIDEKGANEKKWKAFASQIKARDYQPGINVAGY